MEEEEVRAPPLCRLTEPIGLFVIFITLDLMGSDSRRGGGSSSSNQLEEEECMEEAPLPLHLTL